MADPDLPPGFTEDEPLPAGFTEDTPALHTWKLADGRTFTTPADAADADVRAAAIKASGGDQRYSRAPLDRGGKVTTAPIPPDNGLWSGMRSAASAFSAGLLQPTGAALDAIVPGAISRLDGADYHSMWDGGSFSDAYHHNLALERGEDAANATAHPVATTAGTVAGALASPVNKIAAPVRGAGLLVSAARAGEGAGVYGLIHGAATSQADTAGGVAKDAGREALYSSAAGSTLGAGLHRLISAGTAGVGAASRLMGWQPTASAATDLVASRLAADNVTPADAAAQLAAARNRGVPAVLADLGENVRALGGSVSRQPGAARTTAIAATTERQFGQGERINDAINRDLGPTTDTFSESNRLQQQARAAAAPLYDAFHANPSRTSDELVSLTQTPAGKAAMAKAQTIAANDRVSPNKLGFDLDDEGNVKLTQNPSPQTLDYVKQGLDDVLEQYRDTTTGKLNLTPAGRSVENVRSAFVREMDNLYPDYAPARAAYAGPASLRDAMADGRAALNKSANEINQRLTNMSDAEQAHYALGLRSAISDSLARAPDGADQVRRLIGSASKRQALSRVFGSSDNFDRFMSTLGDEQSAFRTYGAVNTGSPTAARVGEDAANTDLDKVGQLVALGQAATKGHTGLLGYGATRVGEALKFGVGQAGQRTREDAASLLFSSDPSEFRDALERADLSRLVALGRRQAGIRGGAAIGGRLGSVVSAGQRP